MDNQAVENYNCKSCGQQFEGNYCPSCGQKKIVNRLVLKDSVRHLFGVMVNFERGLWHSSILMFKNPAKVINDYINGITKPYIHPFRYLFLWLTIQIFLMFSTGLFDMIQSQMALELQAQQQDSEFQLAVNQAIRKYMQIFFVLSIPFLAWGTRLLFRKKRLNFAEHLVVNSFGYGTTLLMSTLILPLYFFVGDNLMKIQMLSLILNIAIHAYIYKRVFEERIIPTILKSIMAVVFWLIGFCLNMILFFIFYIIYLIIYNPDLLKSAANKTSTAALSPELMSFWSQLI
tara:strand:- start:1185 stop:2048 length:864 start_codon:yes stop_codon:yes gene_type:complete